MANSDTVFDRRREVRRRSSYCESRETQCSRRRDSTVVILSKIVGGDSWPASLTQTAYLQANYL